jgi:hypothetical protein
MINHEKTNKVISLSLQFFWKISIYICPNNAQPWIIYDTQQGPQVFEGLLKPTVWILVRVDYNLVSCNCGCTNTYDQGCNEIEVEHNFPHWVSKWY